MSRARFVVFLVVVTAADVAWLLGESVDRNAYMPGDCPYYATAAESLLRDGDFDLTNQVAPGGTRAELVATLRQHEGCFAISPDGRVVPKHSVLMPIFSLPFRALFGRPGFLLFNGVQVCLLVYALSLLAGDTPAARVLALAAYVWSPLIYYAYNYSPDVLGALLVAWAYLGALRGRWVWCGLAAGLAVWAKVYLAAVVLPAGLLVAAGGWRAAFRVLAAGAAGVAPFLALNAALYGGPLVTGYDRMSVVQPDGTVTTADHYSMFNEPFLRGLGNLLFDRELGAIPTAPLWALWPLGVWFLWRAGQWRLAAALAGGVLANLVVFACYDEWHATIFGNRFLFPAFVLGFAAQGALWESICTRLRPAALPDHSTKANAPGST